MAAHYGVSLDRIPMSKPHNMSKTIYERLKKQMLSRQGSKNDLEKRSTNDVEAQFELQNSNAFFHDLRYNPFPENFKQQIYPKTSKVKSIVDNIIDEDKGNYHGMVCRFRSSKADRISSVDSKISSSVVGTPLRKSVII